MYQAISTFIKDQRVRLVKLKKNHVWLSFDAVLDLWEKDDEFCHFFRATLNEVAFEAYFWETPAWTFAYNKQPFEMAQVESHALAKTRANPKAFEAYFQGESPAVVSFKNLGGDAQLVVPCPMGPIAHYAHLAAFIRNATSTQCRALLGHMATVLKQSLNDTPIWLSTSGLGVPWLHLRLDSHPKYYAYAPYRQS